MSKFQGVARLFGVEIGERFRIKELHNDYIWWFEEAGLHGKVTAKDTMEALKKEFLAPKLSDALVDLLCGRYSVQKMDWRPYKGGEYWYVAWTDDGNVFVHPETWRECFMDYLLLRSHNCFRTKSEADKHADEVIKRYIGAARFKEWKEARRNATR